MKNTAPRKHKLRYTQISKEAFLFFINYDRERLDVKPLTQAEQERVWKKAQKFAPRATDANICLMLTPSEISVIRREGYKTKTRYFTV